MMRFVSPFIQDESGATAVEYGLIVAAISISIMAALHAIGVSLTTTFGTLVTGLAKSN